MGDRGIPQPGNPCLIGDISLQIVRTQMLRTRKPRDHTTIRSNCRSIGFGRMLNRNVVEYVASHVIPRHLKSANMGLAIQFQLELLRAFLGCHTLQLCFCYPWFSAFRLTNSVQTRFPLRHSNFIEDGPWRMASHPNHQRKLAELRASIETKYETELKSASFIRRWILRRKINAEFEIERNKIGPSDNAL